MFQIQVHVQIHRLGLHKLLARKHVLLSDPILGITLSLQIVLIEPDLVHLLSQFLLLSFVSPRSTAGEIKEVLYYRVI